MSVGWSFSPIWTGQRGGDWPEPVRRNLRLPDAAKNGLKRDVEWPQSSGLKREVDWPNSLKRGVAWPFSRHPEDNWPGSSRSDWDNLVDGQTDWPKTFTSKAGGQKYVTDQVGQKKLKTCSNPPALVRLQLAGQLSNNTAVCDRGGGEKLLRRGVERDGGGSEGFFVQKLLFSFCEQGGGKDNGGCDKELRTGSFAEFRCFWSN